MSSHRDIIRVLEAQDLERATISEIEEIFSQAINHHTRPTMKLWFDRLFRARIITHRDIDELTSTTAIWYPDWSKIDEDHHRFSRCSDKGQNFFYASNYLEAVIKEIDPKDKDLILIGIFAMRYHTPAQAQFVGITQLKKTGRHKLLAGYEFPSLRDQQIEEWLQKLFKEKILKGSESRYKLSIAFSRILLKNVDIECIVYPSVASNLDFENYGLKPDFVDKKMYCEGMHIYSVKRTSKEIVLTPEKYGLINTDHSVPRLSTVIWVNNSKDQQIEIIYKIQS